MPEKDTKSVRLLYFRTAGKILLILLAGFTLYLAVSTIMMILLTRSQKEVQVPDVTGQQFTDVYNSLLRKGLSPRLAFHETFDMESGIILEQHPEAGEIIPEGDPLKLTLSRNGYSLEVPDLRGKSLPVAKNSLRNLHFHGRNFSVSTGAVSYIRTAGTMENIVVGQSPLPGEKITPDRRVNLLVSAGTGSVPGRMPEVAGQTVDLAFPLLETAKIHAEQEIVEIWDQSKNGVILSQQPAAGAPVKEGDTVKIKVGIFPAKGHPYYSYEKIQYTVPSGYEKGLFEVYVEDDCAKRMCFSGIREGGQQIVFAFHRSGRARISVLRERESTGVLTVNVEDF